MVVEGGHGDQALAAALDIQRRLAIHQHYVRARHALHLLRPGQRKPERIGRIGRRQDVDHRRLGGRAFGAQAVDRARQGELGRAQALDEIAAPNLARFLHGAQHRVDRGEPTRDAFPEH